ncbi:nitroreductase family protein [Micromonospora sp. HUAS LYJ1]|uniref:nitroreductase family protein n=1 Tax=Micromonospora sp. HUAS LYJ1 TaxID=3061626 RepID=UPI002671046D|nr:nitroreductase family protein [Micromonospora sp. HUAS LYJ1]WKU05540.1 nitroreductase family protein [Micromonospora sp. HUAS LYJ1]
MIIETRHTDHLLSTTPAVRRKLDLNRPVEHEVLATCLRIASYAPSPGNVQAWRWLVLRNPEQRAGLGALFREAGTEYLDGIRARLGANARIGTAARAIDSVQHLLDVIDQVPVLVVPCLMGRSPGRHAEASAYYGGIWPAIWSFQLALRSRGLGTVPTTLHLRHEKKAAALLGLPPDVTQIALLPVAYTTSTDFRPPKRTPAATLTYLDTWGTPMEER